MERSSCDDPGASWIQIRCVNGMRVSAWCGHFHLQDPQEWNGTQITPTICRETDMQNIVLALFCHIRNFDCVIWWHIALYDLGSSVPYPLQHRMLVGIEHTWLSWTSNQAVCWKTHTMAPLEDRNYDSNMPLLHEYLLSFPHFILQLTDVLPELVFPVRTSNSKGKEPWQSLKVHHR